MLFSFDLEAFSQNPSARYSWLRICPLGGRRSGVVRELASVIGEDSRLEREFSPVVVYAAYTDILLLA